MWKFPRVVKRLLALDVVIILASLPAFGICMQILLSKVAGISGSQYDMAFYGSFIVLIVLILYLNALVLAVIAIRSSPIARLLEDGKVME